MYHQGETETHMLAYLDNSATTRQSEEVTRAMIDAVQDSFGNPSSLHRLGVDSEKLVKLSRKKLAAAAGAKDEEIYFTSGGTESDNTAIFGAYMMLRRQGNHIITTEIEHPAVLECFKRLRQQGAEVTYIGVDERGFINMDELASSINDDTILVSVMHANNESGAVQPIADIASLVKKKSDKAVFHCDAVQSYGKIPVNADASSIDLLSASAHKIHGPKGMGLLYVRKDLHLPPYLVGGGQERGMRSGTENVPGIAGFGAAAGAAFENMSENYQKVTELRDRLLSGITSEIGDIKINSPVDAGRACMPHILNVSFLGTRGEVLLHMLEQSDIYVSTGSACSSHKKGGSHVLTAMGLTPDEIEGAVRFSLSPYNTVEEIDYAVEKLKKAVASNRRMLGLANKKGCRR